jgi:alkanesulfonate monooxygenase SsuD/methylene tetrahydromethanopterin reductase-like flavin-dependent oxidoreductase (luciferase family)
VSEPGKRPFKVGVLLPTIEGSMARATPRWSDIVTMARRAEALGFDSLWMPDHLLFPLAHRQTVHGVWECWSLLAALAAATERVELGPLVSCTGFRNPALLAKMADTVDEISGGRLILGLGAGDYEYEHGAFGFPYDHRVSRFEEALTIIHTLLHEGRADFAGKYYQVRECELRPRGPRPNGPPIMVGALAHRPRMLGLVARYADQWNVWYKPAEELIPLREAVDAACREVGRDPATLPRTATVRVNLLGRTGRQGGTIDPLAGSPEQLAEGLRAYAGAGISHVQIIPDPSTLAGIEALAPTLEILDRG